MTYLRLDDGRTLEYEVTGPENGVPLVLHNGTPSAVSVYAPMAEAITRQGLRCVSYSRAGYAGSTPLPGRTVASVAGDVAALLDALGADRFLTAGWSGGGPHTLACAALLPERCVAAATVAGVAPHDAPGLDWLDGMGAENVEEFGAARAGEQPLTAFLRAQAPVLGGVRPDEIAAALGDLAPEVDRAVLTDDYAVYLAELFRAAVSGPDAIAGWRDDDLAFVRDWGFDLDAITVPVAVWQGGRDRMVPAAHGDWLAARIPGATAHLDPAEGHLSIAVKSFATVVADLAAHV